MKVILKENIEKLGFKDEIVDVKNGFARNFLIPKNKAIIAPSVSKYRDVKPVLTSVSKSISNDSPDFSTIFLSIFFDVIFLIG